MRGKACGTVKYLYATGITPAYAGKSKCTRAAVTHTRDHPRLCGEKRPLKGRGFRITGSPPPMRGKGQPIKHFVNVGRITPAYAGKRDMPALRSVSTWDHPRLCGEKTKSHCRFSSSKGSPPPMRGKVFEFPFSISVPRITPAYAGKSSNRVYISDRHRDHPRLCGEKRQGNGTKSVPRGSPPPMRGKVFSVLPACHKFLDHPRLCGEKIRSHIRLEYPKGSPPPMRGKEPEFRCQDFPERITPAYAGKSPTL